MFFELKKEDKFRESYFEMLKSRLTMGSMQMEELKDEYSSRSAAQKIFGQFNAINYAFSKDLSKPLSHYEFLDYICEIASKITNGEVENFRNVQAMVTGSNVERTKPSMIRNDLVYLIDDYNYQIEEYKKNLKSRKCNDLDIFLIEAQFHIRFLHIHPFEDGNGRVSRIMLTRNLCEFDKAPCLLTKENKSEYCSYIENSDVKGLATFIEKLSNNELEIMVDLYKNLDEKGEIESNKPKIK